MELKNNINWVWKVECMHFLAGSVLNLQNNWYWVKEPETEIQFSFLISLTKIGETRLKTNTTIQMNRMKIKSNRFGWRKRARPIQTKPIFVQSWRCFSRNLVALCLFFSLPHRKWPIFHFKSNSSIHFRNLVGESLIVCSRIEINISMNIIGPCNAHNISSIWSNAYDKLLH